MELPGWERSVNGGALVGWIVNRILASPPNELECVRLNFPGCHLLDPPKDAKMCRLPPKLHTFTVGELCPDPNCQGKKWYTSAFALSSNGGGIPRCLGTTSQSAATTSNVAIANGVGAGGVGLKGGGLNAGVGLRLSSCCVPLAPVVARNVSRQAGWMAVCVLASFWRANRGHPFVMSISPILAQIIRTAIPNEYVVGSWPIPNNQTISQLATSSFMQSIAVPPNSNPKPIPSQIPSFMIDFPSPEIESAPSIESAHQSNLRTSIFDHEYLDYE